MRWLFFALIVWLSYLVIKKLLKNNRLGRQIKKADSGLMARCNYCGVFLPESEALSKGGGSFCCREHYELAKKENT